MDFSGSSLRSQDVLLAALVSVACFGAITVVHLYKNVYSYWTRKGIRGPTPLPIFGNFLSILFRNQMKRHMEWMNNYGKIYGTYFGTKPRLVIADPEVMQQVCIKDFDAFQDHDLLEFFNKYQKNFLFFLKGDHWKKVRAMMTPTFTSGKIKRMFRFLDECANDLIQCFEEQLIEKGGKEAVVNAKDTYSLFTMDAIATCCYGLKLERSGSKDIKSAASRNRFVDLGMRLFQFNYLRVLFSVMMPKPFLRMINYKLTPESILDPLAKVVDQLIQKRRSSTKKYDDYLQLLVDARLHDEMDLNETDSAENHHAGLSQKSVVEDQRKMVEEVEATVKYSKVELSELEILSGSMFLLMVGLETTGTLLTHCSYALAFHPEIQERLHDELLKIVEFNDDKSKFCFSYETLTACNYLDSVLSETLRIVPAVVQIDRISNRDYKIEKYNLDLPKGSVLMLAMHALMNDPDWWEEPTKFNPDRFMPGNKEKIVPGSYCPFGIGPRHCIGMRFSLTEAKLALAKMVMKFRFEPAPNAVFPPEIKLGIGLNRLKYPMVKIIPRA